MCKTSIACNGQIWWCTPEVEDDKRSNKLKKVRPWIIISPDSQNYISSGYLALPLTHTEGYNSKYKIEVDCPTKPGKAFSKSWIICHKPRQLDEEDLLDYIGVANKDVVLSCIEVLNKYLLEGERIEYTLPDDYDYEEEYKHNEMDEVEEKEDETKIVSTEKPEFLILHPNVQYYNKYCNITNSTEVDGYIKMYNTDKIKFCREFHISNRYAKSLYRELYIYRDYLFDKALNRVFI